MAATTGLETPKNEDDDGCSRLSVVWRASEFVRTVTTALWSLRGDDSLVDVTLSCEGRTIRAHRVLLAACSPYLKAILQDNPCRHPVLIFRDLRYDDLHALLHFMYHGEVSVPQQRLASFLAAAETLQVRGLTDDAEKPIETTQQPKAVPDAKVEEPLSPPLKRRRISVVPVDDVESLPEIQDCSSVGTENDLPTSPTCDRIDIADDNSSDIPKIVTDDIDAKEPTELISLDGLSEDTNQDGDSVKFRCQLCWKSFKHPISLSLHRDSHTGKTQCPICHRFFSRSYDMRCHLSKIHQDQVPDVKLKVSKTTIENNT